MKRPLDNKIFQAAEKANVEPGKTVVVVDMSNVINWKALKANEPANDDLASGIFRVSVPKMSSYLEGLKTHPMVRVFSPHVYVSDNLIQEITGWVMNNCPEILNSPDFTNPDQSDAGFNSKLARAIKAYMAEHPRDTMDISAEIRAKMSTLTRAQTWFNQRQRFEASGFEVYGKRLNFVSKTLAEDKTHGAVVDNVLQVVDDVQQDVGEMENLMNEIGEGRESLQQMRLDLDNSSGIFNKVSKHLSPEDLAQIGGLLSEFREKLSHINRAADHIKDQIVHAPSKKCDLDVDIVSETLDPETLKKYGVFVLYSGDGDFRKMYEILHREKKRVVVVSPERYLAEPVKEMALRGQLEWHKPNFDDNIWREIHQGNSSDKKPA